VQMFCQPYPAGTIGRHTEAAYIRYDRSSVALTDVVLLQMYVLLPRLSSSVCVDVGEAQQSCQVLGVTC
jgi:hypothetical protein